MDEYKEYLATRSAMDVVGIGSDEQVMLHDCLFVLLFFFS